MTYRQKKTFATLVSRISTAIGLEASVILHFINTDLERLCQEKLPIHSLRLGVLDAEVTRLANRENALLEELRAKETHLQAASSRIDTASASLKKKSEHLEKVLEDIKVLQVRIAELDASIRDAALTKRQLEYDLMMKSHRRRELTDRASRLTRAMLLLFTLIAIAIAAVLIWRMHR